MRKLLMTTAGDLTEALEEYISNFENPNSPESWERFFAWMEKRGGIEEIGEVPNSTTVGYLAGSLRDEGVNARVLKMEKKDDK